MEKAFLPSGWSDKQKAKFAADWRRAALIARVHLGDFDLANECEETARGLENGVSALYRYAHGRGPGEAQPYMAGLLKSVLGTVRKVA